jgi:hypothetical protein
MRALAILSIAGVTAGWLSACVPAIPEPTELCDPGRIAEERARTQPTTREPPTPSDAAADLDAAADAAGRADSVEVAQDYWHCRVQEAEARYHVAAFHRRGVAFAWHHTASVSIFVIVVAIVCLGFLFAGMQFRQSLRVRAPVTPTAPRPAGAAAQADEESPPPPADPVRPADDPGSARDHEFEVSLQTIRLRSSALGLVIWVVSIAFFYLYLAHVYPLHEGIAEERPTSVESAGESP